MGFVWSLLYFFDCFQAESCLEMKKIKQIQCMNSSWLFMNNAEFQAKSQKLDCKLARKPVTHNFSVFWEVLSCVNKFRFTRIPPAPEDWDPRPPIEKGLQVRPRLHRQTLAQLICPRRPCRFWQVHLRWTRLLHRSRTQGSLPQDHTTCHEDYAWRPDRLGPPSLLPQLQQGNAHLAIHSPLPDHQIGFCSSRRRPYFGRFAAHHRWRTHGRRDYTSAVVSGIRRTGPKGHIYPLLRSI